jgi:hypothetical protein
LCFCAKVGRAFCSTVVYGQEILPPCEDESAEG